MLLQNINLSLRYYILLSLLLLLYMVSREKYVPFELSFVFVLGFFFNCVDSLLAYHDGAIIAILSKNDVPFDVGDKCSYSIELFREQNRQILYMF